MSFDQAIKDAAADISSFMPTDAAGGKMLHGTGTYERWVEGAIRRAFERHQYVSESAALQAIREHNHGCLEACGKTSSHEYVRKSRDCDSRRDCTDCPKDWMIDLAQQGISPRSEG